VVVRHGDTIGSIHLPASAVVDAIEALVRCSGVPVSVVMERLQELGVAPGPDEMRWRPGFTRSGDT
jgi:hypothetical protein